MSMWYLSLCSGIEAASVAWRQLGGWDPIAFAEIEPFPCAVLTHHYPDVPNFGDITKIDGKKYYGTVDLIVGGTPCQDFSVAGKRAGMVGERSGLAKEFIRIVSEIRPTWIVWENVPGVFSTNGGRDFGSFIKALDDSGYCCAWRVLDAQFFGVPQRRRRVFVVGYLGDWRPAAKVLFERESLRGDTQESKKARKDVATKLTTGARSRGEGSSVEGTYIPYVLQTAQTSANGHGIAENVSHTLDGANGQAVAYIPDIVGQAMSCKWAKGTSWPAGDEHHNLVVQPVKCAGTLCASGAGMERPSGQAQETDMLVLGHRLQVRRLTPRECERLMGFPDDYTAIEYRGKPASDSVRYKALGNSMAVPVMRWIGERIDAVEMGCEL